jgi:hypothetical protein
MLYTRNTKTAMKLCYQAHRDQVDKSGCPYVFHPFHVAEQMETEHEICAALLHDVMEDTGASPESLVRAGIPAEYVETCKLLTPAEGVPYLEYVAALAHHPVARKVKLADLEHNSDVGRLDGDPTERDIERLRKYEAARQILLEAQRAQGR